MGLDSDRIWGRVRVSRLSRGMGWGTHFFTLLFTRIQNDSNKQKQICGVYLPPVRFPIASTIPSWSERLFILVSSLVCLMVEGRIWTSVALVLLVGS